MNKVQCQCAAVSSHTRINILKLISIYILFIFDGRVFDLIRADLTVCDDACDF